MGKIEKIMVGLITLPLAALLVPYAVVGLMVLAMLTFVVFAIISIKWVLEKDNSPAPEAGGKGFSTIRQNAD